MNGMLRVLLFFEMRGCSFIICLALDMLNLF